MKKLYWIGKVVLTLAFVLSVSSCATNSQKFTVLGNMDESTARFTDEDSVNAVLQFSSWKYTLLARPQFTEDGYLQQIHRETLNGVFDRMKVRRGTAVVVVG